MYYPMLNATTISSHAKNTLRNLPLQKWAGRCMGSTNPQTPKRFTSTYTNQEIHIKP